MTTFSRRIHNLGNIRWIVQKYVNQYGWNVLIQKVLRRYFNWRRAWAPFARTLFQFRRFLFPRKPIRKNISGRNIYFLPRGSLALHLWGRLGFERPEIEFVTEFLQRDMVFLDIGSNAGAFALPAAKKLKEAGSGLVYAFEPTSWTYQLLLDNLSINHLSDVVIPINSALGAYQGTATLSINALGKDGLNTIGGRSMHADSQVVTHEQVSVTTVDAWLSENRIEQIDFIKMDVEGAELDVLKGARKLLQSDDAPPILYESHTFTTANFSYHPVEIIWLLQDSGYHVYLFDKGKIVQRPARLYNGMMVAIKSYHRLYAMYQPEIS